MSNKEHKPYVFLTVAPDLSLDSVSAENLHIIREGLGWDIQPGTFLPELLHEPQREYFIGQLMKGFSGQCFSFQILFPCQSSRTKDCEVVVTPSHSEQGKITKIGIVIRCADEFHGASDPDHSELKALEYRMDTLARNLPGIVLQYQLRPDGADKLLYVSEAVSFYYGVSPQEALEDVNLLWSKICPEFIPALRDSISESAKALETWQAEWKYFRPDGTIHWHRAKGNPKKLVDGSINWDSIILDVTHEKEAEIALAKAEKRFEKLVQDGVEMVCILTPEGKFSYNSPYYQSVLGYTPEELKGFPAFSMIHPEDVSQLFSEFEQVFNTKVIYTKPYRVRKKDGSYIWLKSVGTNFLDDPLLGGILVNSSDVSELVRIEQGLKASELKYKYIFENNPAPMYIWDRDTSAIIGANERFERMYGYTREELLTMTVLDIRPLEDYDRLLALGRDDEKFSTLGKGSFKGMSKHIKKSGELMDVEVNAQAITYEGKRASLVLVQDVTQQRLEEFRLKLLESVITNANDAVVITEAEPFGEPGPRIVYVNEAFTRMTGYTTEEVLGKSPRILQGPKTNRADLNLLREAMENWQSCEVTTVNYRKDGEEFWINFSVTPLADENGAYKHWISIQRDVTAQKIEDQKKELLAQIVQVFGEEKRFNFALDRSLEHLVRFKGLDAGEIWLVNSDKTKLNLVSRYALTDEGSKFFSKVDKKVTFRRKEGVPGQIWDKNQVLVFDDLPNSEDFTRKQAILSAGLNGTFGIPLLHNNSVIGVAVFVTKSKATFIRSFLEVVTSISQILGAEIYRKKVEDELSQIFEAAQDIICIMGFDGKFKKINKGATYLLGYSEEELLSKSYMDFVHPEDLAETENVLDHLCQGQNFMHFFNRIISKDGEVIWLDWNSTVVEEEELIYSVAKNITEEKELQNLLESANKMARIGFWEVDKIRNTQYWSPISKEIHEVDPYYLPTVDEAIQFYREDARVVIREAYLKCCQTGEAYDLELPIITAKGNPVWIRTQGQAEFREGVCHRVFGTTQDISSLKNAQLKLREAFEQKNAILESIGDAFFSLDQQGLITYWNTEASRIFGGEKEKMLGKFIWDLHPFTSERFTQEKIREAYSTHKSLRFEQFFSVLDKWLEISVYPSEIGLSVYLKDNTVRKATEELIRQSNERFEQVAQVTDDAIWDWDFASQKMYWGEGFRTLFGVDLDRVTPNIDFWISLIHPEDLQHIQEDFRTSIPNPTIDRISNEYRFRKADGTYAHVVVRGKIQRNEKGQALRIIGAVSDITGRKEFESSLKSLNEKLEARARELAISNAELEQFAYVASHDLQEPLRMVSSFLSQLEIKYESQLDDRARKYIHFAVDGAKRMRQIILDLLEFSRIGRIAEKPEEISLDELVAEVCRLQSGVINSKSAQVSFSHLPVIKGFRTPMIQLFQNLISNAIKYSREGVVPEVIISSRELQEFWEISVEDNGIGMEAGSFDKIFVIFQRLHARDEFGGTGIGLSIVKKIVENLGGKIWVESAPGVGSTFRFTLKKQSWQ